MRKDVNRLREWGVRVDQTTPEIAMRELEPDLWIDPARVSVVYVVRVRVGSRVSPWRIASFMPQ
jgi:hypothetical protein